MRFPYCVVFSQKVVQKEKAAIVLAASPKFDCKKEVLIDLLLQQLLHRSTSQRT